MRPSLLCAPALALLLAGMTAPPAQAEDPWFAANQSSPLDNGSGPGPAPRGTAAADVTGDGRADLVTIGDFSFGNLLVVPNTGAGSFGPGVEIPGTTGVQGLDLGDLDGNGTTDIAAMSTSEVKIVLGDGQGGFTVHASHPFTLGGQVEPLIADLDGDGDRDILAPTFTGIQTLLNDGAAGFVAGPTSPVAGAMALSAVSLARLDAGPTVDLFAVDGASGTTFALLGDGTGRFTVSGQLVASGFIPEDVAALDLDDDGYDDAAVVGSFSFSLATARTDGTGRFRQPFTTSYQYAGPGPTSAAVADFDRDGRDDLVVSSLANPDSGRLLVLAGNGTEQMRQVGEFAVGSFPQNPLPVDFDGDSRPDLVTVGPGAVSFLRNTTP